MLRRLRGSLQPFKSILLPFWKRLATSQSFCTTVLKYRVPPDRPVLCVGLMRTGTHSIASMLDATSAHEPETHILWHLHYTQASISERIRVLCARAALLQVRCARKVELVARLR